MAESGRWAGLGPGWEVMEIQARAGRLSRGGEGLAGAEAAGLGRRPAMGLGPGLLLSRSISRQHGAGDSAMADNKGVEQHPRPLIQI